MLQFNVDANIRKTHGKGAARTLRREGNTPAVLYGAGKDAVSLELNTKSFTKTLFAIQRRNAIINLDVKDGGDAKTHHVMLKEVQVHPIKDTPVHADFCSVDLEKPMVLNVPVEFKGKAKGVDLGGIMNIAMATVEVKGLVMDIPDSVEIDVSNMNIGDSISCSALPIPDKVELVSDPERTCVAVVEASRGAAAEAADEAAGGEATEENVAAAGDEQTAGGEGEAAE